MAVVATELGRRLSRGELGRRPVLKGNVLVVEHYYPPGQHPKETQLPIERVDGWTGPEEKIEELIPTKSILRPKGKLVVRCSDCDPGDNLPVPEGFDGFTDGDCEQHVLELSKPKPEEEKAVFDAVLNSMLEIAGENLPK